MRLLGGRIGTTELIIILVVLLLVLGPKRLPELARSTGRAIKEFRGGLKGAADDPDKANLGGQETDRV